MHKFEIEIHLNHIRDARAELNKKVREFNIECDRAMKRLIHEAAANMMSAQEVGKHAGMSTAAVKTKMKKFNLNPSKGKTLLSKNAAEVLASNAEIMGIEPHQIDLMSPLAYLPAGKDVSAFLETPPITELPEKIQWHRSEVLMAALKEFGETYQTRELETELDVIAAIERVIAEAGL